LGIDDWNLFGYWYWVFDYLMSIHKLRFLQKSVIPAKAGIQSFQGPLDAGSSPA
jgi:hypothetical protein